jgi:hypothetical protein
MFSTTFCSRACCGEPDEAKAPPSIITSFCMSWIISAQRDGSSDSPACALARSGAGDVERDAAGGAGAGADAPLAAPARMNGSRRGPTLVPTA